MEFKKAGVAAFEWNGREPARLLFLIPPRFLR